MSVAHPRPGARPSARRVTRLTGASLAIPAQAAAGAALAQDAAGAALAQDAPPRPGVSGPSAGGSVQLEELSVESRGGGAPVAAARPTPRGTGSPA